MPFHGLGVLWLSLSLGALGRRPPCPTACACKQGASRVDCSGLNGSLPLAFPPEAEHLDLSHSGLQALPARRLGRLWKLQVLLLSGNGIGAVADRALAALERLRKLDLGGNRIAWLGSGFSEGLVSLQELVLAHNRLRELRFPSFQHFESLQKLRLQGNLIASIEAGAFRSLTGLRQLCLQHNRLAALPGGLFATLQRLQVLDLEGNRIGAIAASAFAPLRSLTTLNLAGNAVQHVRFKTLLALPAPGTRLALAGNPWVCDCDLQRVFAKLRSVRRLALEDYGNVTCAQPQLLRGLPLASVDAQLCTAETATVLVITFTVFVTVVAAIVMAERNRKKRTGKHWSEEREAPHHTHP